MPPREARPKPTPLKLLAGTYRRDRATGREARPRPDLPPCPSHLNPAARREWRRTARDLYGLGLLTRIDRAALAAYCQAWGRWVEAEEALRRHGVMVRAPSDYPMQSPYLSSSSTASAGRAPG